MGLDELWGQLGYLCLLVLHLPGGVTAWQALGSQELVALSRTRPDL